MFHPSGPNFLLSKIKALKKQRPHIRDLKAAGFSHDSNSVLSIVRYDLMILFFNPFGGSIVALTPFCKIVTGNLSLGIDVIQILNMLDDEYSISSIKPSSVGRKLGHKWQFCNTTHW
jgi:hypothetical protein